MRERAADIASLAHPSTYHTILGVKSSVKFSYLRCVLGKLGGGSFLQISREGYEACIFPECAEAVPSRRFMTIVGLTVIYD